MKHIKRTFAVAVVLLFCSVAMSGDDITDAQKALMAKIDTTRWVIVYITDKQAIAVDKSRIVPKGRNHAEVWLRWDYATPQTWGSQAYDRMVERQEIDCGTPARYETLHQYAYLSNDSVREWPSKATSAEQAVPKWEDTVPDSVGESMVGGICQYLSGRKLLGQEP